MLNASRYAASGGSVRVSATKLPQTMTYWLITGNNGTGGKTWSVGVAVPARIARVTKSVTSPEGKNVSFNDAVYSDTRVPIGGYIYKGDANGDAEPHAEARRVIDSVSNLTMTTLSKMVI